MIKRVNFTGRRKIPRSRVDLEVGDGQPRTFDAVIDIAEYEFPPHAAVYLEAMCAGSNHVQRFSCGTVARIAMPDDRRLSDLNGRNVFFTLKVVDQTESVGRLIGIAELIRPNKAGNQTEAGRQGILPVDEADLGQRLWKLDFQEREVFLIVNSKVDGLVDRVRSDPTCYALIYPEVVRAVLIEAFANGGDIDDEDESWPTNWLAFGQGIHPEREKPPASPDMREEQLEWIDTVVDAFCEQHSLTDRFFESDQSLRVGE